ncbi:hypothetical protein SSPIM334S_01283 [Streptomyces spiroverticillatus]
MVAASVTATSAAPKPKTERVSLSSTGKQLQKGVNLAAFSVDGRYAAFTSDDSAVVPGDTNGVEDVFVRDLRRGTVVRVNLAPDGSQADAGYYAKVAISANGRYIAYTSDATNLEKWPEKPAHAQDVYVYDRTTGRSERVSVGRGGASAQVSTDDGIAVSDDGRHVAFGASSQQMEGTPTSEVYAYVVDRRTGTATRISDHMPAEWTLFNVGMSADGSRLYYAQGHPRGGDRELWDVNLRTGVQRLVNADPGGGVTGWAGGMSFSADGGLLAYITNGQSAGSPVDSFLYDTRTGKSRMLTHEGKGGLGGPTLSADGRRLAYIVESPAEPGGGTGDTVENVYVRDLATGRTQLATPKHSGGPLTSGYVGPVDFGNKGRDLMFVSWQPDFVPGDTNNGFDAFVRHLD